MVFEVGSKAMVETDSWEEFHAWLSAAILDLADAAFVIVDVVRTPEQRAATIPPPMTLMQRVYRFVTGDRERNSDPFVQFIRVGGHVTCDCGGPADDRGSVQLSREQQEWILGLGWAPPSRDRDKNMWVGPNYAAFFPHDGVPARIHGKPMEGDYRDVVDGDAAAALAIETLRGPLGADSPRRLQVERSPNV